jgi:hypothetical protein
LKIITEFATEHVDYQLINKDRHSGDDETHEKWNNVMTQSSNKLKHAEDNKDDSNLKLRLLTEEWLNDPQKMKFIKKRRKKGSS